ncbi:MAG TPA: phage terminase small subunit P27 family [Firmicutes bacterium]|nr:phage terminase small subunit P27 family [Bacillota bacterium]
MGRRARPVELLKRQGKTHISKARARQREEAEARLKAPADAVKPPSWLGLDARKVWKRIVPVLLQLELATNANVDALAVLCDAVARHAECAAKLQEQGLVIQSPSGGAMQNPYALLQVKYAGIIRQYAGEFGMTPATLAKLALPKDDGKPKDKFEELFGS